MSSGPRALCLGLGAIDIIPWVLCQVMRSKGMRLGSYVRYKGPITPFLGTMCLSRFPGQVLWSKSILLGF